MNEKNKYRLETNHQLGAKNFIKSCNMKRRNGLALFKSGHKRSYLNDVVNKLAGCELQKKQNVSPLNNQIKAAKQLAILLLAFIITWLPYFITFIVIAFCPKCVTTEFMSITIH